MVAGPESWEPLVRDTLHIKCHFGRELAKICDQVVSAVDTNTVHMTDGSLF